MASFPTHASRWLLLFHMIDDWVLLRLNLRIVVDLRLWIETNQYLQLQLYNGIKIIRLKVIYGPLLIN